jgi:ribosomal peptide maturation radical SAM protein 1
MPFANLRWPNLGISLLKGALLREEISCEIANFNFDFAERIGLERYQWLADCYAFVLGGERLFAREFFGRALPADEEYFAELRRRAGDEFGAEEIREWLAAAQEVRPFLDACLARYDWSKIKIVGFSASFQQTLASLCLARRIKAQWPHVITAMGGAACEGEMGIALWQQFPEIDYVFLGEADFTFPALVREVLSGKLPGLPPGVVGPPIPRNGANSGGFALARCERWGRLSLEGIGESIVMDLDALPYPDFDDYFARLAQSPLGSQIRPFLFFESSRGCWWGEKHHCKFCGLNGSRLVFRSKSSRRILQELADLAARYGVRQVCAADNIFDYRYFHELLPKLIEADLGLKFVYELKCNLTRAQIEQLVRAGLGAAQLGIETFVTHILRLVNKGATGLQNLQTLKWFSEQPVEVEWNFLYGFPGERPEDYQWLAELIPSLVHLAPPLAIGRVRMDRFSPYFDDPTGHGLVNPRPLWAFRYVYPFREEVLCCLAYHFEFDFADGRDPRAYAEEAIRAAEKWQDLKGQVAFRSYDREDATLILLDTRPGAKQLQRRLTGWQRELYLFCDQGRTLAAVGRQMAGRAEPVDPLVWQKTLRDWVHERIMALLDDRYLSLATRSPQ